MHAVIIIAAILLAPSIAVAALGLGRMLSGKPAREDYLDTLGWGDEP